MHRRLAIHAEDCHRHVIGREAGAPGASGKGGQELGGVGGAGGKCVECSGIHPGLEG